MTLAMYSDFTLSSTWTPTGMPSISPTTSSESVVFKWYSTLNSQLMLIFSVITCFATSLVIIMCFRYPHVRRKTYVEMVLYSCICDFIGAIFTALGEQKDGTPLCFAQGMLTDIFPLSSILWTMAIAYLLYSMVMYHKPIEITWQMHLFCWGFPIFLTMLPLSTSTYGAPDGVDWCFLNDRGNTPEWLLTFWEIAAFYGWIALFVIILLILLAVVYHTLANKIHTVQSLRSMRDHLNFASRRDAGIRVLWLYPVVIIFCWSIPAFSDIWGSLTSDVYPGYDTISTLSYVLPISQGFITSTIFFLSTKSVRKKIFSLLHLSRMLRESDVLPPQDNIILGGNRNSKDSPKHTKSKVNNVSQNSLRKHNRVDEVRNPKQKGMPVLTFKQKAKLSIVNSKGKKVSGNFLKRLHAPET